MTGGLFLIENKIQLGPEPTIRILCNKKSWHRLNTGASSEVSTFELKVLLFMLVGS